MEVVLDFDEPLLDNDRLIRAATAMISSFGIQASAEASKRAEDMRLSGCYPTAATWDEISKIIKRQFNLPQ